MPEPNQLTVASATRTLAYAQIINILTLVIVSMFFLFDFFLFLIRYYFGQHF